MSEDSILSKLDERLAVVETVLGGIPLKGEKGLVHISKQMLDDMAELRATFAARHAALDAKIDKNTEQINDFKSQAKGAKLMLIVFWTLVGFVISIVFDIIKLKH